MDFKLVGCKTYVTLRNVYSKGQVYSIGDSEREAILGLTLENGMPVFQEALPESVVESKAPVTLSPPVKKTIVLGGKKSVIEKKAPPKDISTKDLNPSEPDALV